MKITTKIGDKGDTRLCSTKKVSKADEVFEGLGTLDTLQAFLGWCKFILEKEDGEDACKAIDKVQDDLYRLMSFVGCEGKGELKGVTEEDVEYLEEVMDRYEDCVEGLDGFVKPGTTEASSRLHIARSVCRRAERQIVKYYKEVKGSDGEAHEVVIKYMNRLSDLLFVLAVKFG